MEFRLSGAVEAFHEGRRIELGRRRERCLLGLLLLEVGRPVPVERLVELLWDGDPPDTAHRQLRVHVSRLRARIHTVDGTGARIVTLGEAYLATADPRHIDIHRFRAEIGAARGIADPAARAAALAEALTLWRGPALGDAATDRLRHRLTGGLDELHLLAIEERLEALLACGRHREPIDELGGLVGQHPLRQRLVGLLMLALHRDGRQPEALEAYRRLRTRLTEELGLDPDPEVQRLHEAILRADPSLDLEHVSAARRPAQLPSVMRGFAGRADLLARLDGIFADAETEHPAGDDGPPTVILSGTAGVGKSTLAIRWVQRVAHQFPDGHLYANLRGFDPAAPAMTSAEVVRAFLDALGVAPQRVPTSLDAQVGLYRSLLAGRRVLLVLDNASDADQVRPLLPGSAGCLVLVTSRNLLPGLVATEGAHSVIVDLPPVTDAREMLARRIGPDRMVAEPAAVDEIIQRCARLPLALAIVAARAVSRPGFSLASLAQQMRASRAALDVFAGQDAATDVRAVFYWSYGALGADEARLFRMLDLHPGPDLGAAAAASLAGVPPERVHPLLAELTGAHLLHEHTPGRYVCHDLLHAYAAEQGQAVDTDADRQAAVHRLLDHYLHTAYAADRLLYPYRDPLPQGPPLAGVTPEPIAGTEQALAWFTAEHPVLLALVRQAATVGDGSYAGHLAAAFGNYFDRRGHWHDWLEAQHIALDAAQRLGDRAGQAHANRGLGLAYQLLGRDEQAYAHLRSALDLQVELGDEAGQARTHLNLGWVYERQGHHRDALRHSEQALDRYRAAGHRAGQARALNGIGWCHALLGDHLRTLECCTQALALHEELGDRSGAANTWDSLGYAHHQLGDYGKAVSCFGHALGLFREDGDRYGEADVLSHLGDTHLAACDLNAAHEVWSDALAILTEIGHHDAEQVRAKLYLITNR